MFIGLKKFESERFQKIILKVSERVLMKLKETERDWKSLKDIDRDWKILKENNLGTCNHTVILLI